MSTLTSDVQNRLRIKILEEQARSAAELDALLDEARQVENWATLAASAELRTLLNQHAQSIAGRALHLLGKWRGLGGSISLNLPNVLRESGEGRPEDAGSPLPREDLREPARAAEPARGFDGPRFEAAQIISRVPVGPRIEPKSIEAMSEPAEPASPESIARLKQQLQSGGSSYQNAVQVDWQAELAQVLQQLAPGGDDEAELERVYRAIRECDRWRLLPRDMQRNLVGMCASRLRRLQDERQVSSIKIEESFSRLSGYSKREQPGYVIGLSRGHRPLRETWEEDADSYWDRLSAFTNVSVSSSPNHEKILSEINALLPEIESAPDDDIREAIVSQLRRLVRDALKVGVSARDPRLIKAVTPFADQLDGMEFRTLRRQVRASVAEDVDEQAEEATPVDIPPDWRWWPRTRGRRALMVGGDPREPNRLRLKDAFEFSELDWEPAEFRRNSLQTVRDRVRSGKVDLVIILGSFVGHDADDIILPACRERSVDWVHVDRGYGVVRLRRAIERFLDPGMDPNAQGE